MNEKTIVLPSARAIRNEQLKIENPTLFLPNYITMSDFVSKLCIVKDLKMHDEDSRVLLLLEAADFKEFSQLQIERNFFTFTKNSSYIFKFFEELSAEMYDIQELDTSDIYAEYEEHISILQELHKRYEKICAQRKVLDRIFLPKLYIFHKEYALTHKKIEIHAEGHLTNFELELLQKCCVYSEVNIHLNTTKFNTKMQKKFLDLGIELEKDYSYIISLNAAKIVSKEESKKNKKIHCESLSESLLQVAFVKTKLYEFIQKGYEAQNIAVILPDEKFAELLKVFDEKSNFNFAMGDAFSKSKIYQKLDATMQAIESDTKENEARLERVGEEIYLELFSIYYKSAKEVNILEYFAKYKEFIGSKVELKIFEEEMYNFKNILPFMSEMSVKSLLHLFLQRISQRTLDDVRGGKITVMGVLETRAVAFDAVIIVDFSDSNVPRKSDKDMFLNTKIRTIAGLPTMNDRENLQKHYYERLINSSKEVAICYVESSQSSASRFLKQLHIKQIKSHSEQDYAQILFHKRSLVKKEDEKIVGEYSFKEHKLSNTKLKTFLTCKRKFYYRYIKHINAHEIPKDMPKEWEIGIDVHSALKELYSKKNSYTNAVELKRDLQKELDNVCGRSELEKYLISMYKKSLDAFCENEIVRFQEGWKVLSCEENFECDFAGVKLIGQIDRIDQREDEIFVLDYKTGSYPLYNSKNFTEATDFQLEFYYLLTKKLAGQTQCGYYDLKESKIVNELFLEEKLGVLESNIKDILMHETHEFDKCDDLKNCIYCEFSTMCQREK
ncbi:MAG: PD-(D/E)XK nuclease family protein [Sulfurimonas sp.]|nr:PD-(D/E)XK nuclease family protein [Sulfurimonas sp.]MBU3939526.1 PD-(D/E)XK nuclease family protein [bacterium]MBU4024789.1 PD-(D/E)XK nuclease family protein [bacterium]MBU4059902.1 PD-(D/E)XK nuclease family protein [bacterium]